MSRRKRWLALLGVLLFLAAGVRTAAQAPEVSFLFAHRGEAGSNPVAAVAAHFDADGVLDLAVGNADSNDVSILFGNPDGSFQFPFPLSVGQAVIGMIGADLDNNGTVDLIVLNSSRVAIFRNTGAANFELMQTTTLGFSSARVVRAGLVNGDSNIDLVAVNSSNYQVLLGTGTGTFTVQTAVSTTTPALVVFPDTLALGELNNDGLTDMVIHGSDGTNGRVSVYIGNGLGAFQAPGLTGNRTAEAPYDSTGGDLAIANVDGLIGADVISLRSSVNGHLFLGNGASSTPLQPPIPLAISGKSFEAIDLDGDNFLDLVIAQDQFNDIATLLGNGDGTFREAEGYATGARPVDVQVADIDADTEKDFAAPTGASVYSARGTGGGAFQAARNLFVLGTPVAAVSADFNEDNKTDLVVADSTPAQLVVFKALSGGRFGPGTVVNPGSAPVGMATGDFNLDGHADLVTAHAISDDIAVFLGNGDGTFAAPRRFSLPTYGVVNSPLLPTGGLALGDFNRDGLLDAAVAAEDCPFHGALVVYLGDGTGNLNLTQTSLLSLGSCAATPLLAADLDQDDRLDLFLNDTDNGTNLHWWRGRSDGGFDLMDILFIESGKNLRGMGLGDFNQDGRLDIALASVPQSGSGASVLRVLSGQPNLTFTTTFTQQITDSLTGLEVVDVNGDGVHDALVTQVTTSGPLSLGSVVLWLGNGDGTLRKDATLPGLGGLPNAPSIGDLDRDGKLDVVTLNFTGRTATVLLNSSPNPVPGLTSLSPSAKSPGSPDFTLTVEGTRFIANSVVRWDGSDRPTTFVSNTRLQAVIPAADIAGTGSASVTVFNPTPGGGTSGTLTFSITTDNPLPIINSLLPATTITGSAGFTLKVFGRDFLPTSVVQWNGSDRATTFFSDTELRATIPAADLVLGSTVNVTVFTPAPAGGSSVPRTFTISNPVPALASNPLSPSSVVFGGPDFILTVSGSNFVSNSVVRWNGADRATTYVSSSQLQATILAADIAAPGTADVTVFTPGPGGGLSASRLFTINSNPVPSLSSISPTNTLVGGPDFTLTLSGFNFTPTSVVRWGGSDRTTTYVSGSQLQATILAADIAAPGTASVTVFNPAPGGGTSSSRTFSINNPAPSTTSLSPSNTLAGGPDFTLTVNGSGFIPASVVRWNGADRTTAFVDANQVTADISAADIASPGSVSVTVFNPTPGGGTSSSRTFTIIAPPPPNDDFANAIVAGTTPFTDSQSTTAATIGGTDPTPVCGGGHKDRSVWYQYTPATNGQVTADTFTSNYDTVLSAYTGSPGSFVSRACNDQALGGNQSQITFNVTGGTTYSFMVSSFVSAGGSLVFHLNFAEVPNPVPALTTLSPSTRTAGGATFTLTVNGSNFVGNSVVRWNDSDRTTTFVTSAQVTASIPASDIAAAGSVSVTVFNPAPGGGASNALTLPINNPSPSTTSLSPSSTTAGGSGFTLTVNGSGFVPVSVVRWNGADRTTTYVSGAQLTADIPAGDIATGGTASVTVFNPSPGGGTSLPRTFTINNPAPTAGSLSPTNANAGGAAFTLTVNGSNFVSGSVVRWNGSNRTTTFVNSTQLTAAILATDIASGTSAQVTVFNSTPGGGTSNALTFTINTPPNATFRGNAKDVNKVLQPGVTVGAYQAGVLKFQTTTAANGTYSLAVNAGSYDLVASKPGFLNTTKVGMGIAANQTLTGVNFKLFRPSFFQGTVTQKGTTTPIQAALVEAIKNGVTVASTLTAPDGSYSLQLKKGTYTLRASKTGFKTKNKLDQNIGDGATKTVNIALPLP